MKINKIRPKFYFSTKIEIKISFLVFVKIVDKVAGTQRQFSENICSEDD